MYTKPCAYGVKAAVSGRPYTLARVPDVRQDTQCVWCLPGLSKVAKLDRRFDQAIGRIYRRADHKDG